MFGNDRSQGFPSRRAFSHSGKDGGVTILTSGCHFAGKLYCKGATRIGGTVDGEVIAEGLLIVEEDAVINAQVKAEEVVVHGRVEGNLSVQRKIELCGTADVKADVITPNLVVHEGALYNGRTTMKRPAVAGEAGTREGKMGGESAIHTPTIAASDDAGDQSNGLAARVPDISFA